MGNEPKRLFVSVADNVFLDGLKVPPGQFVPTRLVLRLGDRLMLAMRVNGEGRRFEVPAIVVGRRTPAAPQSALRAGVIVRLTDPQHPSVQILEDIIAGRIVEFQSHHRMAHPVLATAAFQSPDELTSELRLLLEGEPAQFPLDRPADRGDRLCVTVTLETPPARGQPRTPMPAAVATFEVEVKTVVRHDDEAACLAVLADRSEAKAVRELLRTITGEPAEDVDTLQA